MSDLVSALQKVGLASSADSRSVNKSAPSPKKAVQKKVEQWRPQPPAPTPTATRPPQKKVEQWRPAPGSTPKKSEPKAPKAPRQYTPEELEAKRHARAKEMAATAEELYRRLVECTDHALRLLVVRHRTTRSKESADIEIAKEACDLVFKHERQENPLLKGGLLVVGRDSGWVLEFGVDSGLNINHFLYRLRRSEVYTLPKKEQETISQEAWQKTFASAETVDDPGAKRWGAHFNDRTIVTTGDSAMTKHKIVDIILKAFESPKAIQKS
jgi:hypothetical protein